MSRTQAYVYLFIALVVVITAYVLFTQRAFLLPSALTGAVQSANQPISQPPYTKQVEAQLAASNGFQELVSYTDRGFEPAAIAIPQGDTIRFTNNSHHDLWVSAMGQTLYPATAQSCGPSAFDSCHVVKSGEFWEFTFAVSGTWTYKNNMMGSAADTGTVTVQ